MVDFTHFHFYHFSQPSTLYHVIIVPNSKLTAMTVFCCNAARIRGQLLSSCHPIQIITYLVNSPNKTRSLTIINHPRKRSAAVDHRGKLDRVNKIIKTNLSLVADTAVKERVHQGSQSRLGAFFSKEATHAVFLSLKETMGFILGEKVFQLNRI